MQTQGAATVAATETSAPVAFSRRNAPLVVGVALAIVGTIAYGLALSSQAMAGNSFYPWGFYIALFYTAASAGAGLLIVGSVARGAGFVDGDRAAKLFGCATALLVAASLLIVVDLGSPSAILLTYVSANADSPVFFDAIVLPLCIIVAIAGALVFARAGNQRSAAITAMSAIGLVAGFALLAVEAWLLTTCSGKDAWGVLLGAGPALLQACTMGVAIVVLFAPASKPWRAVLGVCLLCIAASIGFDVVLNQGETTVLGLQLTAIAASPLFWIAVVGALGGGIGALVGARESVVRASAGAGLAAVLLFKIAILQGTQSVAAIAGIGEAGVPSLNVTELMVGLGIAGVGMIVYALAGMVLAKLAVPTSSRGKEEVR